MVAVSGGLCGHESSLDQGPRLSNRAVRSRIGVYDCLSRILCSEDHPAESFFQADSSRNLWNQRVLQAVSGRIRVII